MGLFSLKEKILIAPVGMYKERLRKSILNSGAQRVYLIKESKGELKEITEDIATILCEELEGYTIQEFHFEEADFSSLQDIYHIFTKIIEKEKSNDITIDVTSTTKESVLVASWLRQLYNVSISFVPSSLKRSPELLTKRIDELKKGKDKPDKGGEYIRFRNSGKEKDKSGFTSEDIYLLKKLHGKKMYKSMSDLASEIVVEKKIKKKDQPALKKYWIRLINKLEDLSLIHVESGRRKARPLWLTEAGTGIIQGIEEARYESNSKTDMTH
jgi:hypothetical protein